jgi:hypothetical protein
MLMRAKSAQKRAARAACSLTEKHTQNSHHKTLETFDERIYDVVCFIKN